MTIKYKPVVCLETYVCYPNPKSASESTGCSREGIIRVCQQKQAYCQVGNKQLTWMYAYDFVMLYGLDTFLDNVSFGESILDLMGGIMKYEK